MTSPTKNAGGEYINPTLELNLATLTIDILLDILGVLSVKDIIRLRQVYTGLSMIGFLLSLLPSRHASGLKRDQGEAFVVYGFPMLPVYATHSLGKTSRELYITGNRVIYHP